jgi:hypothetical protein
MSAFQATEIRFRNAATLKVRVIPVSCDAVESVLQLSRALFSLLDYGDPYQAALGWKIWEFRVTVLFTLFPFDNLEIGLRERLAEIVRSTEEVPGIATVAKQFEQAALILLDQPENPKHRLIISDSCISTDSLQFDQTGFVAMMAMGRTFGFPKTADGHLVAPRTIQVIESRKNLISSIFDAIIIPGSCHYLSTSLFIEIFHEGRARTIDVLTYPSEYFYLRQCVSLPESSIFRGRLVSRPITCTVRSSNGSCTSNFQDPDASMKSAFWQITHGAGKSQGNGLVSARYVLCEDSRGFFISPKSKLLVWHLSKSNADFQLGNIPVERIGEGDLLVTLQADTGYLVDLESAEAGFERMMDEVSEWRPALERLLLVSSPDEIAQAMLASGASGASLAQSIRNWADGTVYGPGNQKELRILLALLIDRGKLVSPNDFDQFVADHWKGLKEIRAIRSRAGADVRKEIHRQLLHALEGIEQPEMCRDFYLENGFRVQLGAVAAVDEQISWVPAASLMRLSHGRGGRWRA